MVINPSWSDPSSDPSSDPPGESLVVDSTLRKKKLLLGGKFLVLSTFIFCESSALPVGQWRKCTHHRSCQINFEIEANTTARTVKAKNLFKEY